MKRKFSVLEPGGERQSSLSREKGGGLGPRGWSRHGGVSWWRGQQDSSEYLGVGWRGLPRGRRGWGGGKQKVAESGMVLWGRKNVVEIEQIEAKT